MTASTSSESAPAAGTAAGGAFGRRSLSMVMENRTLGSLGWLTLQIPGWPGARPGQFALLQAKDSRCFLGRPLSVSQQDGEMVSFLIAPIGPGTRELCGLREGELVWVLGPLGNGFDLDALTAGPGRTMLVGGGVGVAPFPLLLSTLAARAAARAGDSPEAPGAQVIVLLGFRDGEQAAGAVPVASAAAEVEAAGISCPGTLVSEDGTVGRPERVTDALWRELLPGDRLAVCGPWVMTEAVARVCASVPDVRCWFSLEAGMACGVGSCHGCVVPLADGQTVRVCREGPVFPGELLLERGCFSGGQQAVGA